MLFRLWRYLHKHVSDTVECILQNVVVETETRIEHNTLNTPKGRNVTRKIICFALHGKKNSINMQCTRCVSHNHGTDCVLLHVYASCGGLLNLFFIGWFAPSDWMRHRHDEKQIQVLTPWNKQTSEIEGGNMEVLQCDGVLCLEWTTLFNIRRAEIYRFCCVWLVAPVKLISFHGSYPFLFVLNVMSADRVWSNNSFALSIFVVEIIHGLHSFTALWASLVLGHYTRGDVKMKGWASN